MTVYALPPIVGASVWQSVMDKAGQGQDSPRCQCAGACGQPHVKAGGRCPREHGQHVKGHGTIHLAAAPADLAIEGTAAVALPVADLRAWCPTCYASALRKARTAGRAAALAVLTDSMEGLF